MDCRIDWAHAHAEPLVYLALFVATISLVAKFLANRQAPLKKQRKAPGVFGTIKQTLNAWQQSARASEKDPLLDEIDTEKLHRQPVSYESAKEALDRIKDWAVWMTGLQTAAIGVVAYFVFGKEDVHDVNCFQRGLAFAASLWMGLSIVLSTWVLSSLPSIQIRLKYSASAETEHKENDIFEKPLFTRHYFLLGPFTAAYHTLFLFGLLACGLLIGYSFLKGSSPKPPAPIVIHCIKNIGGTNVCPQCATNPPAK